MKRLKIILEEIRTFVNGLISFLAVIVISRHPKRIKQDKGTCYVLGMGPSLRDFLTLRTTLPSCPIFAVNYFCLGEDFFKVKPDNYIFVDPVLIDDYTNERWSIKRNQLIENLAKVDWNIQLFVPYHKRNSKLIIDIKKKCPLVTIRTINVTPVDGHTSFRNFIFKWQLGMPKAYNVLNAALMSAIFEGYTDIKLFGADHSWIEQFYFNEKEELCAKDIHYNDGQSAYSFVLPKGALEEGIFAFASCLKSYRYIEDFAKNNAIKIVNCSRHSYLDVFDREVIKCDVEK